MQTDKIGRSVARAWPATAHKSRGFHLPLPETARPCVGIHCRGSGWAGLPSPWTLSLCDVKSNQTSLPSPGLPAQWGGAVGGKSWYCKNKGWSVLLGRGVGQWIPFRPWVQVRWQRGCAVPRSSCVQMGNIEWCMARKTHLTLFFPLSCKTDMSWCWHLICFWSFPSTGCMFFKAFYFQSWPLLRERKSSQQTSPFKTVLVLKLCRLLSLFFSQLIRCCQQISSKLDI